MNPESPKVPVKKSPEEIKFYQNNGKKFNSVLLYMRELVEEGMLQPKELEEKFNNMVLKKFRGYSILTPFNTQENYMGEKFNHSICISKNDAAAHGKPGDGFLYHGDVVSVDCGIALSYKGKFLNFDSAFTVRYGKKTKEGDWILAPQTALNLIREANPADTYKIAELIEMTRQNWNDNTEYHLKSVVALTGHGIGYALHEPPTIHNMPGKFLNVDLFEGLVFCAEPIFVKSEKGIICSTCIGSDGWKVSTTSGEPASHFETMYAISNGQVIDLIGVSKWKF